MGRRFPFLRDGTDATRRSRGYSCRSRFSKILKRKLESCLSFFSEPRMSARGSIVSQGSTASSGGVSPRRLCLASVHAQ